MAINFVNEVVRLAGAKKAYEQPTQDDWHAVESELNAIFPSEYKALVSALGEGEFGCGFNLRNPCSTSTYCRLSPGSLRMHQELIADLERKLNIPLYPDEGGHIVIGGIDRQDFYLKPDQSGNYPGELVWLDIDTEEIRPLKYTLPQFIHDLYLGLIEEPWAEELRVYFWREGKEAFFTPRPGRSS